jgi:protein subunit release factor A
MNINENELEITLYWSPISKYLSAEVGVQVRHIRTNIIVKSIDKPSQHLNKLAAIELLKEELGIKD